ncbi:phospholipid/cholesterol/gamma-HCH transport system substrate-binding protein [Williamsia limnetica]|jgi:phospholipid/cholesterol/gamma-HCH transport system substrate-binding protein|uniref:Phospholipid/cholesterol/gamma-HCH transport system substrate-binding protein n=1 Tax=Williamsia limnetica TaxID=882452 RepID=A0A318RMQ8_WILLI|nr:MCE family protein [Williamsia limnetica]PYE15827.1 phospholipid/cholesterol/gamma-HCH transport system substrate-binding protein [Williamsia limnetica]
MGYSKPLIGFSLFAVLALVLTWTIWSTLQRSVPGETNKFTTYFNDASGLHEGDDVRMAGVRVGRVDAIELDTDRAEVTFEVQKDQSIYSNTRASIKYQNLIGQRYVGLDLVEGPEQMRLSPGSTLKEPSQDSFDVSALLAGFQPVFDTLDPDQVNALSESLVQTFQGNEVSLSYTIEQVGKVATNFADNDQVIGAVITNLSAVMGDLSKQGEQMQELVANLAGLIEGLNANSPALGSSVQSIGSATDRLGNLLGTIRPDVRDLGQDLKNTTDRMIDIGPKLDQLAIDLPLFLVHFPMVMGEGAYLNIYACELDVSIGGVLFPPGLISQIGGTNHSVVCR